MESEHSDVKMGATNLSQRGERHPGGIVRVSVLERLHPIPVHREDKHTTDYGPSRHSVTASSFSGLGQIDGRQIGLGRGQRWIGQSRPIE